MRQRIERRLPLRAALTIPAPFINPGLRRRSRRC
jgi:hypothetical protein